MVGVNGGSRPKQPSPEECSWGRPFQFDHEPTEHMFQEYIFHIRRHIVSSVLGVCILMTAVLAILHFVYQQRPTEQNLYHTALCVLGISLYIFVNTKYLKDRRKLMIVSCFVWILLLLFAVISLPVGEWGGGVSSSAAYAADGLWQLLFIIYCLNLLLSFSFFITLLFGIALSLLHIVVVLVRLPEPKQQWKEILVNSALLTAVNVISVILRYANERTHRKSFVDCRQYIAAKVETEEQHQKLGKVLDIVLPEFMCREVSSDLTMYNDIVCPRRTFAKLYDGVSIMWISIIGLDKLKSQRAADEFVSVINDLSLTFELLCRSHNCLPISCLGDSYCAINGVPLCDPDGAKCCVNLCLDMMQAIQLVRQFVGESIEVLVGVHYGLVATGVVGTYRWQYKCCGSDMLLAKHVALSSVCGKIHITEPCIRLLPLDSYDVQPSTVTQGLGVRCYFLRPVTARKMQHIVKKFNKKLENNGSLSSFPRLDSLEKEEPFYKQLIQNVDTRPGITSCLLEGKAFLHRSSHDVGSDAISKSFQQAIRQGSIEHQANELMSFFTLRFHDRYLETTFSEEHQNFGLTLTLMLIILGALSIVHFTLLPRTIQLLSCTLVLFLAISSLLICLLATKLKVVRCVRLTKPSVKMAVLISLTVLTFMTMLLHVVCVDGSGFYSKLPAVLRSDMLGMDPVYLQHPYYIFMSGIMVLFLVSSLRLSHIILTVLMLMASGGYIIVISYTHSSLYHIHDDKYRSSLPPLSVLAMVAILHFAILHILIGRHNEWVNRLNFIWKRKKFFEFQSAQDLMTLKEGVLAHTLPAHVISYYRTPEGPLKVYSASLSMVGVAFVTIPNFPTLMSEYDSARQSLGIVQIIHDITSAFDHLLRRIDFRVVEKVYDQSLTFVLVSGAGDFMFHPKQASDTEFTIHHLCKLLDLVLDMKHCLFQLNAMFGRGLALRAGVSVGAVTEGVLGLRIPQYNIWGPAVDMARKLELTGKINNIQVNKEMAQLLRQRFQFQSRSQNAMPVLSDLQPYIVMGRRLQSVVASDNVSVASEASDARSPQHKSLGSISQADTVLVTSQQFCAPFTPHPCQSSFTGALGRIPASDSNPRIDVNSSSGSTPSGSISRTVGCRDSFRENNYNWKPSSLTKSSMANRPMSPELPAVHYTKINTPPSGRVPFAHNRGTIVLTQANVSGNGCTRDPPPRDQSWEEEATNNNLVMSQQVVTPYAQPKLANVVSTSSMRGLSPLRTAQLCPLGEVAVSRESLLQRTSRSSQSPSSDHEGFVWNYSGNQHRAVSSESPSARKSSPTSSNPASIRSYSAGPYQRLLDSERKASPAALYKEPCSSSEDTSPLLGPGGQEEKAPNIQSFDKIMQMSVLSDRMHTSMEGNVSSASSSPDDGPITFFSQNQRPTNQGQEEIGSDASLSPLLKHQLNRFAQNRESPHKSPHLSRKNASASPVAVKGLFTISSLESPTHSSTPTLTATSPISVLTFNADIHDGSRSHQSHELPSSPASFRNIATPVSDSRVPHADWHGARPKDLNITCTVQSNSVSKLSPPPLPIPQLPSDTTSESDLSEDNTQPRPKVDTSATEYDNMYSTDNGTLERSLIGMPRNALAEKASSKFMNKLERMQRSTRRSIKELYSEIESDAADCESLVGDTDYETEPIPPPSTKDYNHPLQKLQWTESKLLALLKPGNGTLSTMGSSLRHCRSMELLPSEQDDNNVIKKRFSHRFMPGQRLSQTFEDNMSLSSAVGSEFSRSDPYLSDSAGCDSEYDNFRSSRHCDDDGIVSDPISEIELSQFDDFDFEKFKINENFSTEEYMNRLQHHLGPKQRTAVVTDV